MGFSTEVLLVVISGGASDGSALQVLSYTVVIWEVSADTDEKQEVSADIGGIWEVSADTDGKLEASDDNGVEAELHDDGHDVAWLSHRMQDMYGEKTCVGWGGCGGIESFDAQEDGEKGVAVHK